MLLYLSLTDPDHFLCQVHQNYLHRDGYDINRKRFSLKVVCYLKNTKLHFPQTGITCETFSCISIDWILLSVDDRWQTGAFYSLSASWFGSSAGLSKYCFWEVNMFVINEALESILTYMYTSSDSLSNTFLRSSSSTLFASLFLFSFCCSLLQICQSIKKVTTVILSGWADGILHHFSWPPECFLTTNPTEDDWGRTGR